MEPMHIESNWHKTAEPDRNGFIRKVYGILAVQLSVTAAAISYVKLDPALNKAIKAYTGFVIGALIIATVIEFILICCNVARKVPTNYILLSVFTLLEAFIFAHICAFYDTASCLTAAAMTSGVTIALTLYAMFTKTDFTVCGQLFCILCMVGFILSIVSMFLTFANPFTPIISGFFTVLYGLFLIYDTQMVLGKGQYGLSVDDYVIGALVIYLDIMMIFLELLKLFGNRD